MENALHWKIFNQNSFVGRAREKNEKLTSPYLLRFIECK